MMFGWLDIHVNIYMNIYGYRYVGYLWKVMDIAWLSQGG